MTGPSRRASSCHAQAIWRTRKCGLLAVSCFSLVSCSSGSGEEVAQKIPVGSWVPSWASIWMTRKLTAKSLPGFRRFRHLQSSYSDQWKRRLLDGRGYTFTFAPSYVNCTRFNGHFGLIRLPAGRCPAAQLELRVAEPFWEQRSKWFWLVCFGLGWVSTPADSSQLQINPRQSSEPVERGTYFILRRFSTYPDSRVA
jgi:hypothetical protein